MEKAYAAGADVLAVRGMSIAGKEKDAAQIEDDEKV